MKLSHARYMIRCILLWYKHWKW